MLKSNGNFTTFSFAYCSNTFNLFYFCIFHTFFQQLSSISCLDCHLCSIVALRILTISLELGRPIRAFSSRYVVNQRFAAKAFITIPAFTSQTMLTIYLLSLWLIRKNSASCQMPHNTFFPLNSYLKDSKLSFTFLCFQNLSITMGLALSHLTSWSQSLAAWA